MSNVTQLPSISKQHARFLSVIQEALAVKSHYALLSWLQGSVQSFLPHDILLAAWGNPTLGLFFVDVMSPIPAMRTEKVIDRDITPFVQGLFKNWKEANYAPLELQIPGGFSLNNKKTDVCPIDAGFRQMRSAIIHGIRSHRDQNLCLYAVFGAEESFPEHAISQMEMLLPHIDTALRQVAHLPRQCKTSPEEASVDENFGLSDREFEIIKWVRAGKTNQEIGLILGISAYTVKNHLQRIFQKLGVSSRAQIADRLPTKTQRVGT